MKNTLFLDMDGVVADWRNGTRQILGYIPHDENGMLSPGDWRKVRETSRFFSTLPKMQHADELVDLARKFRDTLQWELLFLTAVPHNNDVHWAFYDKVQWAQKHYPDIPVHFGPYSRDKHHHCKAGDILVDDRRDNCEHWIAAGGTAIKVNDYTLVYAIQELDVLYHVLIHTTGTQKNI